MILTNRITLSLIPFRTSTTDGTLNDTKNDVIMFKVKDAQNPIRGLDLLHFFDFLGNFFIDSKAAIRCKEHVFVMSAHCDRYLVLKMEF